MKGSKKMPQRKSFKDNPALQFISDHSEEKKQVETDVPMKNNPLYIETRSKRLNILIQPSIYLKIKGLAGEESISVNELIHRILEDYLTK